MFLKHPGSAVRFGVATLFSCSEAWRYSILNLGIVHFTVTGKNLKSELNGKWFKKYEICTVLKSRNANQE